MWAWRVRATANWCNLSTPAGLALARLAGATTSSGPHRLYLAEGYGYAFPHASAFTVGSVILTRHPTGWLLQRPHLLAHEERHASQYAACGGLLFIPLYLVATAWSWARTGDRASGNVFERWAGLIDGGYRARSGVSTQAPGR